jgi:hypothetical protein
MKATNPDKHLLATLAVVDKLLSNPDDVSAWKELQEVTGVQYRVGDTSERNYCSGISCLECPLRIPKPTDIPMASTYVCRCYSPNYPSPSLTVAEKVKRLIEFKAFIQIAKKKAP